MHDWLGVHEDIVWQVVSKDFPKLVESLEPLVPEELKVYPDDALPHQLAENLLCMGFVRNGPSRAQFFLPTRKTAANQALRWSTFRAAFGLFSERRAQRSIPRMIIRGLIEAAS